MLFCCVSLIFTLHYNSAGIIIFSALSILPVKCHKHTACQRLFEGEAGGRLLLLLLRKLISFWFSFYLQQPVWIFNSDQLIVIAGILKLSKNPFYMKWYQIIRLWHYPFGTFLNNKVWSMNRNFRWSTFIARVPFILGRWLNITILKSSRASQSALMAWVVWQRDIRSVNGFQCERCQWVSMGLRRSFHISHIFL